MKRHSKTFSTQINKLQILLVKKKANPDSSEFASVGLNAHFLLS